jgi:valyl-tRNA synthetase
MENVHDWCISRQLWWGQRIPAWYAPDGSYTVAKTAEEAFNQFNVQTPNFKYTINDLKQDEDVLDTWFSSWLWPISVFDGFKNPNNADINYYYPTNDLVTAPEILFFWVARMIIAGYEYRKEKPFRNVYLTGIVRDKLGRKMSKSLGNSPDPLDLIDKYGADGVRVGMLLCSPAGNDLPFDESLCEQGRNFANKIWNAFRLVKGWEVDNNKTQTDANKTAIKWFEAKFNEQLEIINDNFSKYRISEALMATYKLVWDDFCAWYLEIIKPDFVNGKALPIDKATYDATLIFFEKLLKILHPFMPFITEEIWHLIKERNENDCIIIAEWPKEKEFDKNIIENFDTLIQLVAAVRNFRNQKGISPKEKLEVIQFSDKSDNYWEFNAIAIKLCNLSAFNYTEKKIEGAYSFLIKTLEFFIPLKGNIDTASEIERLTKELEYNKGFLASVLKKLSNEKFVNSAPEKVIEMERKKKSDAEAKIKLIEEQLSILK